MSKPKFGICANCHKKFITSTKQQRRTRQGKSIYCSEECFLEKQGKTKIHIEEIPCARCGKMFLPTRSQYKRFKKNNFSSNSFCSSKCRWYKEYPHKFVDDYVIVFVDDFEILLDPDIFESYKKSFNVRIDDQNYPSVKIFDGTKKILSRWILNLEDPNLEVDHINGNSLDNRRKNLRIVSHQENMFNKKEYANNTSGIKGVHLNKKGIWVARIQVGGKRICLGSSKDKETAEKLRLEAEQKYFKKYDRKYL